jgi:hypothetical protein
MFYIKLIKEIKEYIVLYTVVKVYTVARVGSSEVVVVRYCSELQFSSSQ